MIDVLLDVRGLMKRFGGLTALRWVDLQVPRRFIISLIGPNGAGKTTLFDCVTGFQRADEGDILFNNRPIVGISPDEVVRAGIARTYQTVRLFGDMTVLEHVMVGMHSRLRTGIWGSLMRTPRSRREEAKARESAMALLDYVGLSHVAGLPAYTLSHGVHRRLEIARALASSPELLLLDEPTAGMHVEELPFMTQLIGQIRDELGVAILLIEHDMPLVMSVSDQVTVLDYGQKIAEGTPASIQRDPRVIEAYLGMTAGGELV